ncbi:MAG: PadR family transcriptional regulator [Clostridia bacterium]|nr:PadR family transcriptional regulator [Clostridia bacterium]
MSLSQDLLRGYTDTIILRQLCERDSYGYEINKQVTRLSGGGFSMKEATLYTAFRRMEEAGYIASYWGNEGSGARRRYYSVTELGQLKLQEDRLNWEETKGLIDVLIGGKEHE